MTHTCVMSDMNHAIYSLCETNGNLQSVEALAQGFFFSLSFSEWFPL